MTRASRLTHLALALPLALGGLTLTGCQDGALEDLGEDIDDAADDVKDTVEDAVGE